MAQLRVMAEQEYIKHPSGLRETKVSRDESAAGPVERLASYFELVEDCMEAVKRMPSRKFNNEQCQYLADKLQVVLQSASSFVEVFRAQFSGPGSFEDMGRCVEIFKLLVALAKQIESFVEGCCKDAWIQAAMTLTNVSEYVSSIGFNLELCRVAFSKEGAASASLTLEQVANIHKDEVEFVKRKASADVDYLFAKLTHGLTEKSLSREEDDLAGYLLQRLHRVKPIPHSSSFGSFWWSTINERSILRNLVKWVTPMEKLGKGASGTVYRAMWLGTPVAKKTFEGQKNPDFKREAEILAGLCHPNITSMFCCAEHNQSCSIIMELMDEDLHELMQRRCESRCDGNIDSPPFTILEAIDIMLQVGEGVNYLHNQVTPSIVHRDLKSSNILIKCITGTDVESGYLHAKVTDFGLSKTKDCSTRYSQQTWNTGTNKWMAPEIINLDGGSQGSTSRSKEVPSYPHKCDVYSFAMVCYEILSGHAPFPNEGPNIVKRKVMEGVRPRLPDHCPLKLKALIEKCWNQEPSKRPSFDVICSELKYMKYLLMTGFSSNQDPHLTIEEPLQTDVPLQALAIPEDMKLSWRSYTDCQTALECLKRTVSCISSIKRCTGSLHFNHLLCERFVSKYLHHAQELLEEREDKIELYSEQCAPTLTALYSTVKEAEFLIQKHCTGSGWIRAAVELVGNTSAFAEVILDLKWYIYALKIAIKVASVNTPHQSRHQKVWDLQSLAMAECRNFLESWESDCKQLRLDWDREVLLSKLRIHSGTEIRSLGSYLAQKLEQQDQFMHKGAFAVNLKASELLHKKVLLGSGSFGKVYKVQWLGMPCAVKQISGTAVEEEVRILSKLHHPNIIQLYGYFLERGTLHLIMELMESTLSEHLETKEWTDLQRSPFFLRVALDCMLQIAKGIRYLHSQGMAHRDLKGDNVLVKPSENPELRSKGHLTVKLTDFEMAKANLGNSTSTPLRMNVGSLRWKAPELFKVFQVDLSTSSKRKHYPFKPDVYSFAMVCYEILSGKKPFSDTPILSTSSFYARVKRGERPKLPEDIPVPGLADYVNRCWDTDPCRRPDFVDICKRIRHFRDFLLQITAYVGWEHKPHESGAAIQEPSTIDANVFMIDITGDWNWEIDYKDIFRGDKPIPGGSGFASVWPAWWRTSEQVLAKIIEPTLIDNDDSIAKFKHEVGLLVRMQHENLVPYLGATRQPPFVVFTEFAHGVTLRKYSGDKTPLSQEDHILARRHRFREAVNIALHIARGMRSLHEEDVTIIHGELLPECILIDENTMTARVADFGLRSFRKPPLNHSTSRWFRRAPEQHLGLPLHTSVDVFSFGTILYELFERERAQHFWKNKRASDIVKHGGRPALDLASCYPRGVKALIERCWAQNWQERPSFGSIVSDLQKTADHLSRSS